MSRVAWLGLGAMLSSHAAFGQNTNLHTIEAVLPNAGFSLLRVLGSLALVLALFFAGVWCFRNWQRFVLQKGKAPRLRVLEVRPLGNRQAIYLVACDEQRMLLGSSPAGMSLLAHLPGDETEADGLSAPAPAFADTLRGLLTQKA